METYSAMLDPIVLHYLSLMNCVGIAQTLLMFVCRVIVLWVRSIAVQCLFWLNVFSFGLQCLFLF